MSQPALVLTGVDRFAVEQREPVEPIGDQVAVDVGWVGVCGTDLHIVDGSHPAGQYDLVHAGVSRGPGLRSLDDGAAGSDVTLPAER